MQKMKALAVGLRGRFGRIGYTLMGALVLSMSFAQTGTSFDSAFSEFQTAGTGYIGLWATAAGVLTTGFVVAKLGKKFVARLLGAA